MRAVTWEITGSLKGIAKLDECVLYDTLFYKGQYFRDSPLDTLNIQSRKENVSISQAIFLETAHVNSCNVH